MHLATLPIHQQLQTPWLAENPFLPWSTLKHTVLYILLLLPTILVTPADERSPIDRSQNGGIPIWKMLELADGPATAALPPTIDTQKLKDSGLGSLVDVTPVKYYTYYQCLDAEQDPTPYLCWNDDPLQPELDGEWTTCYGGASRVLVSAPATCRKMKFFVEKTVFSYQPCNLSFLQSL